MKMGKSVKLSNGWHIFKFKSKINNKVTYVSGFGDSEKVALCGGHFYSKFQLKKDLKRGDCI